MIVDSPMDASADAKVSEDRLTREELHALVWSLPMIKVAAQYQPSWRTVRDFLTPNDYWHPKSLKRVRGTSASGTAKPVPDASTITTRKSA